MVRKFWPILLCVLLAAAAFAQPPVSSPSPTPESESDIKLKQDLTQYLVDTRVEIGRLRTTENRLGFSAQLAALLWEVDEREGRALYDAAFSDLRNLIASYESQYAAAETNQEIEAASGGGYEGSPTASDVYRRFQTLLSLRQQMLFSVISQDPELAFQYLQSSVAVITQPKLREAVEASDVFLEQSLIADIAKTDPAKAAAIAGSRIKNGFRHTHLDLLRRLYKKDQKLAEEFAAKIVSSLDSTETRKKSDRWAITSLLAWGDEQLKPSTTAGSGPPLSKAQLETIANVVIATFEADDSPDYSEIVGRLSLLEKYAPLGARRIRSKMPKELQALIGSQRDVITTRSAVDPPMPPPVKTDGRSTPKTPNTEEQLTANGQKLGTATPEERRRLIDDSKRMAAKLRGTDRKIAALGLLAVQAAKAGDKKLANDLMSDARSLLTPDPRNYQDFINIWIFASIYAQIDARESFPLVEDMAYRLNDTIEAFVKVGEFIDNRGDILRDGEIQTGGFGGSMARGLPITLPGVEPTLRSMAAADIDRTKQLPDRFQRPEVRILARMLLINAVMPRKAQKEVPAEEMLDEY